MQEIADWLAKLGMSEYAQHFAENDIDFTILGDLTDQDLEKVGVASLGTSPQTATRHCRPQGHQEERT